MKLAEEIAQSMGGRCYARGVTLRRWDYPVQLEGSSHLVESPGRIGQHEDDGRLGGDVRGDQRAAIESSRLRFRARPQLRCPLEALYDAWASERV